MREKDIHEIIEQQNPEAKRQIWEKISAELNLPSSPQPKQEVAVKPKRWKWAAIALAVICVVTLSIVLPLTLKDSGTRFCDATQYVSANLEQPLGQYFKTHNKDLLYVDWYDVAEEINTVYGYNINDKNDIFYFTEEILNGETGEIIKLSITDNKTRVDIFVSYNDFTQKFTVKDTVVAWQSYNQVNVLAKFEYKGYVYYLQIDDSSQERLTEIITDMLK